MNMRMARQVVPVRKGARAGSLTACAAGLMLHALTVNAAEIPIADVPLFLGSGVAPNVFFELDDSGSMDWSVLTDNHWEPCAYDSNAPGREGDWDCGTEITDGLYVGYTGSGYGTFAYMFDNTDDLYSGSPYNDEQAFGSGPDAANPIPAPVANDWRLMNSDFNVQYFNPGAAYQPWEGSGDASFTSARSYPESNGDSDTNDAGFGDTRDLTGFTFTVWEDDRGFDGSRPQRGGVTSDPDSGINDARAQSGTRSMFVSGGLGEMTTASLDTGSGADKISFWVGEGSSNIGSGSEFPDATGEELVVEYRDNNGNWQPLYETSADFDSTIDDQETFVFTGNLPASAKHSNFALRFRSAGGSGSGFDYWHIDDLQITNTGGTVVFGDDFESGTFAASKWAGSGGINANSTPNDMVDLWDSHTIYTVLASKVEKREVTYAPDSTGLNPSVTLTELSSDADIANDANLAAGSLAELKTHAANWYQYHRRRRLAAIAAVGDSLDTNPNFRYGLSVINSDNELFEEVPAVGATDLGAHNDALFEALKAYDWAAQGTPLRAGLQDIGEYYSGNRSGTSDPIKYECQQNFTILMSDGYYSGSSPGVGDDDGDGISDTLADVARHYYESDLNAAMADQVTTTPEDSADHQHMVTFTVPFGVTGNLVDDDGDGWPDPDLDVSDAWTPGLDPESSSSANEPRKIDDMWHAAFNSAGRFISAKDPSELSNALQAALGNIDAREASSAAVALNSQSFSTDSRLYQARFNSNDWSGQLLAYDIESTPTADGQRVILSVADSPSWDAGTLLDNRSPATRDIITGRVSAGTTPGDGNGVAFEWPNDPSNPTASELSAAQVAALHLDPDDNVDDGEGADRLAFLRGDETHEDTRYRERSTPLGDIVNSAPVFVGAPRFLYPNNWDDFTVTDNNGNPVDTNEPEDSVLYSDFFLDNEDRTELVYVGSNDGMLHGFDAETGEELIAYVPNAVFDNLNRLTSPNYSHKFFVDGSPTYADAFFGGEWHSVIAGGMNAGGQGVYALDITDPANFSDTNADNLVLWEFTDDPIDIDGDGNPEGDPDMGYSFSRPNIVRLKNGQWAAIFGNGYNNTESDGNASGTGHAVLFIVDLETGELIQKIDTGAGSTTTPNGLATVAPIDIDGDFIVDYAYAGDLEGNLWKFDLTDISNSDNWDATRIFTTETADPDNTGNTIPQPITVRPQVGEHPASKDGVVIYFGTGKYLGAGDAEQSGQPTQTFYAIWDAVTSNGNQVVVEKNELLEQEIIQEVTLDPGNTPSDTSDDVEVRETSDNNMEWLDVNDNQSTGYLGWYMDLFNTDNGNNTDNFGEKAVTDPLLRSGRIIFTTLIPSDSPCDFGGSGWLMELDTNNGGPLDTPPFDLNRDAAFGEEDTNNGTVPGGMKSDVGIVPTPAIMLTTGRTEAKFLSGSSGNVQSVTEYSGDEDRGRQSWEELR